MYIEKKKWKKKWDFFLIVCRQIFLNLPISLSKNGNLLCTKYIHYNYQEFLVKSSCQCNCQRSTDHSLFKGLQKINFHKTDTVTDSLTLHVLQQAILQNKICSKIIARMITRRVKLQFEMQLSGWSAPLPQSRFGFNLQPRQCAVVDLCYSLEQRPSFGWDIKPRSSLFAPTSSNMDYKDPNAH